MFLKLILPHFIYRKATAFIVLFSFLLNSLSPVFAAWDDYERGREAFEQGDNRAAYHALKNVVYTQAVPYLEKIFSDRKSRSQKDLTPKDITESELKELRSLLEVRKQDLRCHMTEDQDFKVSLALKQYIKDSQKRKAPFPDAINKTIYGNYCYAIWLESSGKIKEAVRFFAHAINQGELAALRTFGYLDAKQKALFPLRDLYEEELQFLDLNTEGVFERMYERALIYREKTKVPLEAETDFYKERYIAWRGRAARRGNILRAQQDMLECIQITAPDLLPLPNSPIIVFPNFPAKPELLTNIEVPIDIKGQLLSQTTYYKYEEERDEKATISLLASAAENRDGTAAFHIGLRYKTGSIGNTPSPEKAFSWFTKAALLGCLEAKIALGICHEYGIGTSENKNLARQYYREIAAQGHLEGMFEAGIMALDASEIEEAKTWLERCVSGRHRSSYLNLAELYTREPGYENYARAAQLLREFFSSSFHIIPNIKSFVDIQFSILLKQNVFSPEEEEEIYKYARYFHMPMTLFARGNKYFTQIQDGRGLTLKEQLAPRILEAFMPLIESNEVNVKGHLGLLTLDWVPQEREAIDKIKKGVDKLCSQSNIRNRFTGHFILAKGYHKGNGIYRRDTLKAAFHAEEACKIYEEIAADINPIIAYRLFLNLGYLYMTGEASPDSAPNYEKAYQLTQRATSILSPGGTPYAMAYYNLSRFHEKGLGIPASTRETFRYLDIAAGRSKPVSPSEGYPDAHYDLGLMYLWGGNEYTPQNTGLAIQLLEKAAQGGISKAYLTLGSIYSNTQIGKRDILKAISYYEKGVQEGNLQCALILGFIYLAGEEDALEPNYQKAMDYIRQVQESGTSIDAIDQKLKTLKLQSKITSMLHATSAPKPHSEEKSQKTKTERLIDKLSSTSLDSATKWRKVEKVLSRLISLQGGEIKAGSGSVRHFHIGDISTSMHELHQPGKERGMGYGRAKDLQTLVGDVLNASEAGAAPKS